jgi:hypothetical protein
MFWNVVLCQFTTFGSIIVPSSSGSSSPKSPVILLGLLDPEDETLHSVEILGTTCTVMQHHTPEDFNLRIQCLFEILFDVLCLQQNIQQIGYCNGVIYEDMSILVLSLPIEKSQVYI